MGKYEDYEAPGGGSGKTADFIADMSDKAKSGDKDAANALREQYESLTNNPNYAKFVIEDMQKLERPDLAKKLSKMVTGDEKLPPIELTDNQNSKLKAESEKLQAAAAESKHGWHEPTDKQMADVVKDLSKPENIAKSLIYGHFQGNVNEALSKEVEKGPEAIEDFVKKINEASLAVYPEGRNYRIDYEEQWSVVGPRFVFRAYLGNNDKSSDYIQVGIPKNSHYEDIYKKGAPEGLR